MDAAGAQSLKKRLEQQEHWRQADAVREGRQLPVDPDGDEVEALGDGFRLYAVSGPDAETHQRVAKRLVDGKWQRVTVDEPSDLQQHV